MYTLETTSSEAFFPGIGTCTVYTRYNVHVEYTSTVYVAVGVI